jgi:hypothetical protein
MPAAGVTLSLISYIGTAIAFVFATLSLGKLACTFKSGKCIHTPTFTHARPHAPVAKRNIDEETHKDENQE